MVEPTGYSALDLIGFTDRGDYAAGSTYVKNDLVHYSDNIWRCKLDDTTGQTPAEGTYWTLWIDGNSDLSDLSDVAISSPANGDVLEYDSSTSKWKNSQSLGQLKEAFTNQVNVNGSKNIIKKSSVVLQGSNHTFVRNADDSITVTNSGTASSTIILGVGVAKLVAGKQYVLSGGLSGDAYLDIRTYPDGSIWSNNTESKTVKATSSSMNFTPNDDEKVIVCIRISSGKSASGTFYPMICLKTDYGINNTYVKGALTNDTLTEDSVSWSDEAQIGAVNELNNTATTQTVGSEVTYTVNADKSITATWSSLTAGRDLNVNNTQFTLNKSMKLSGCPSGGSNSTYRMYARTTGGTYYIDTGDGVILPAGDYSYVRITITAGTSPLTFKPMLTPVDYNGPYVPYAKTNRELTDDVADIAYEALTDNGSSEYTLIEGNMWQTKGVTFLYVAVICNTVSPGSGGNHIKISTIPDKFKKPPFIIYPTMSPYRDATTGIGLQLQINSNGNLAVRGGEVGARYTGLFSY